MPDDYRQLLDATIQHLEELKSRGVRQVAVAPETLRVLTLPPPRRAAAPPIISRPSDPVSPLPPITIPASAPDPRRQTPVPNLQTPATSHQTPPASSEKSAALAALRERALACVKCPHLAASRKSVVFGVGNPDADLMFIGEAPGADEDLLGEPFVGAAGQLLTKIIQATGLQRGDVYIANILKCRPDTPGQHSGNRKPRPEEMAECLPFLHEQIDLIQPKVLVALGATAVEGLLGKTAGITKLRGHWQEYRGIPLMPTYHPAYLLRNQAMTVKRQVWEDLLAVMEKLGLAISAKQRNYFLKA